MAIKHNKVTVEPDDPTKDISSDEWNDTHNIEAGTIVNVDVNASAAIDHSKLESIVVATDQVNIYTAGMKQTFSQSASIAGINLGVVVGEPSAPTQGDFWYNTSGDNLQWRSASTSRFIVDTTKTQTINNKTFGTGDEFRDDALVIQNPADTFNYIIQSSAIIADRTITIPLLTGDAEIMMTSNISQQIINSAKFFTTNAFQIRNPANTFQYRFGGSAIVVSRDITIPLLTADGNMVIDSFPNIFTANQALSGNDLDLSIAVDNAERITSDADNQVNIYANGLEKLRIANDFITFFDNMDWNGKTAILDADGDFKLDLSVDDNATWFNTTNAINFNYRRDAILGGGAQIANTKYNSDDSAGSNVTFANIQGFVGSGTAGSHNGRLGFQVASTTNSGALTTIFRILGDGTVGRTIFDENGSHTEFRNDVHLEPTFKLYFDSGNDTLWQQKSASPDYLEAQVGGAIGLGIVEGTTDTTEVNVVFGALNVLLTTATDGFVYIPSMAGDATGTPTTQTGKIPIAYDTTNNELKVFSGGAWRTITSAVQ